MSTQKQSSGSSADSSSGKSKSNNNNRRKQKNKNNSKTKASKKFTGAQTDGALKGVVITQDSPNMSSQLREVRDKLAIRCAELSMALWSGSVMRELRILEKDYVDEPPPRSEYSSIDPNDATGKTRIEEPTLKTVVFAKWNIKMTEQSKTWMKYERNGKSLYHIATERTG